MEAQLHLGWGRFSQCCLPIHLGATHTCRLGLHNPRAQPQLGGEYLVM